jgi:hypothetical protein
MKRQTMTGLILSFAILAFIPTTVIAQTYQTVTTMHVAYDEYTSATFNITKNNWRIWGIGEGYQTGSSNLNFNVDVFRFGDKSNDSIASFSVIDKKHFEYNVTNSPTGLYFLKIGYVYGEMDIHVEELVSNTTQQTTQLNSATIIPIAIAVAVIVCIALVVIYRKQNLKRKDKLAAN